MNLSTINFYIGDIHLENNVDYPDIFLKKNKWFLKTFFKKELDNIKDNIINWKLQKINIFLLWDIIMSDYDNMTFYYMNKDDGTDEKGINKILENSINKYADYLSKYNELFIQSIEELLNRELNDSIIKYNILYWNHDYIIPWNISKMWEKIVLKTNEKLSQNIRYEIIENKFINNYDNNTIIYGELNYPVYVNLSQQYDIDKEDDINHNTLLLDNIISKTKIIKKVIDNYFFNEISILIEKNIYKTKKIDNIELYKLIQKEISNHISKEFSNVMLFNNIKEDNIINWLIWLIKGQILEKKINIINYPYINNFIENIDYINRVLSKNNHNFEIQYQINDFVILIFTIVKNLFTVLQFLLNKIDKNTSINTEQKNKFIYLSHFPFSLDDIETIVWKEGLECKKSSNYIEYEKNWLYYYFNKSWEQFLLLLELIKMYGSINNKYIKEIDIYSGHTHNNIECKIDYDFYKINYNVYSFWYVYENNYVE